MPQSVPGSDPARRGLTRDFSRLAHDGTATAAELREFIGQMRGRNPQEVLGLVAQSSLLHGVTLATIGTIVFMAAFTIGPYLLSGDAKTKKPAAAAAAPAAATPDQAADNTHPQAGAVDGPSTTGEAPSIDKKTTSGVDEIKSSDPTSNPLENKGDDLLDDLK